MMKKLRGESITYLAYVGFLVGFIGLGLFVYALAAGSAIAAAIGALMVISDIATVVLFRKGARKRAQENETHIDTPGVNIFATPLKQSDVDRYLANYRGVRPTRLVAVDSPTPIRHDERIAA